MNLIPARTRTGRFLTLTLVLGLVGGVSRGEVLLQDDFGGSTVNTSHWETVINDTTVTGGCARLNFHVDHHPPPKGNAFRNAGLYGKTFFTMPPASPGLLFTSRIKVVEPPPKGLNLSFYAIGNGGAGDAELDFEVLTTGYSGQGRDKCWLNSWSGGRQNSTWPVLPGFDMCAWNIYQIQWTRAGDVTWFINGKPVRELKQQSFVNRFYDCTPAADKAVRVDVSFWKPRPGWDEAYHDRLDKATTNATYTALVDWVDVRTIGATNSYPAGTDK